MFYLISTVFISKEIFIVRHSSRFHRKMTPQRAIMLPFLM